VTGILRMGGTILGTVNRGDPFVEPIVTPEGHLQLRRSRARAVQGNRTDALVCIGGDGTLGISYEFYKRGIPLVCVPKTIDNDIVGTNSCFGFDTAVSFATMAIDRLHTTAEAHQRVMVVEVMGAYAAGFALHSGVAGGADVILIPGDSLQSAGRGRGRARARPARRAIQHRGRGRGCAAGSRLALRGPKRHTGGTRSGWAGQARPALTRSNG
jgi:6-phosphofructokinase